jgi:hypothetical protein
MGTGQRQQVDAVTPVMLCAGRPKGMAALGVAREYFTTN